MKIIQSDQGRFNFEDVADPAIFGNLGQKIGIAGYDGFVGKIVGKVLSIFKKAVYVETENGSYYLNCNSLKKWFIRVTPQIEHGRQLDAVISDSTWVSEHLALVKRYVDQKFLASPGEVDLLNRWVEQASSDEKAYRRIAAERILNCRNHQEENNLDLSKLNLSSLPSLITDCKHLRGLDLSGNELTAIPSEIGQLTKLSILDISHNQLTELPLSIESLKQLRVLNASHNQLKALLSEIGNLNGLVDINLSNNSLKEIPSEIGNLNRLMELDLSHNSLKDIPLEIGKLNIQGLRLSNNQLEKLPSQIGNLKGLRILDVGDNKLKEFPEEILSLSDIDIRRVNNSFSIEYIQQCDKLPRRGKWLDY